MEKPLWMIYTTHMFIEVYLLIQVALIPVTIREFQLNLLEASLIREFQLNLLEASLVATVPSLVALLTNIPFGILADRFSTKHLLFGSMLIEGFSALFVSQTNSFWIMVLGVSFMRISSPLYHISGLSQISKLARSEQISRSIGFHNALGNVGSGVGLISLTFFLSTLGWRWVYLFWSFPILTWGFIILKSPHIKANEVEKRDNQGRSRLAKLSLVFSSALLFFLVVIGVRQVGSIGSSTFMTTYFVETIGLSEAGASLIFGLGPFIGIVGSLCGGYLAERLNAKRALSLTTLGCAITLSMLSLTSELHFVILTYVLYAFFTSNIWSPINTIVANITPAAQRGLSYSLYFFTEGLIASIAPALTAGVIELTDVWFVIPFSIIFLITSVVMLQFHNHLGSR